MCGCVHVNMGVIHVRMSAASAGRLHPDMAQHIERTDASRDVTSCVCGSMLASACVMPCCRCFAHMSAPTLLWLVDGAVDVANTVDAEERM